MAAREDFRQRLTNALIQSLEEHDGMPWQQGWENVATRPFNPASGVKYKGGNVMGLLLEQVRRRSMDPRWVTLKQANKAGYSVRKGAKAAYVEYWDWGVPELKFARPGTDGKTVEDEETEEQARARAKPRVFYAAVFNGADVVGLPEMVREQSWQADDLAEKLIAATGAEIEHATVSRASSGVVTNAAYYTRGVDKIVVPPRNSFKSQGDYYATVLHELAHWTGHASRLSRHAPDESLAFGSPAYAREELRAEIASFFLSSMLGIEGKAQNHARYATAWLDVLKGDKHEIFRAARDAEQIVDHVFSYAPELREVVEGALAANTLPEDGPKRRLNIPVSDDLPNFIPAGVEPIAPVIRTGRADPRWPGFERTLLETAKKAGINAEAVAPVFDMIEPNFTMIMDGMKTRGLDEEMVYKMIGTQIIDEMKRADVHRQGWDDFAEKVRDTAGEVEVELVESVLQETNQRYQQALLDGVNGRWDEQKTQQALNQVLYGKGSADVEIDAAFVQRLIAGSATAKVLASAPIEDDEDMLTPLGMSEVLPEDVGILDDEWIARVSP